MNGIALQIPPDALKPLIEQVVAEAMRATADTGASLDKRLCYSEAEAAELLGLEPHVLRDERLKGNIKASQIVGRRIRYLREDLANYLRSRPWKRED